MLTNTSHFSPGRVLIEREVIFHLLDDHESQPFAQADTGEYVQAPNPAQPLRGTNTLVPCPQTPKEAQSHRPKETVPVHQQIFKGPSRREAGKKKITYQKGCKNIITMFSTTLPIWPNLTRCNGRKVGFLRRQS